MYDHNQLEIVDSFMELFLVPGRLKPTATREVITARYELCETLAQQLFEYGRAQHYDHGLLEHEVLARCHAGLLGDESGVNEREAGWVVRRLVELEGWACLELACAPERRRSCPDRRLPVGITGGVATKVCATCKDPYLTRQPEWSVLNDRRATAKAIVQAVLALCFGGDGVGTAPEVGAIGSA